MSTIRTTVAILVITVVYILKQSNQEPSIFKRRIEQKVINKALAIIMSSSFFVLFAVLILVETQNFPFIKILFEVVSAFATVGLSTGISRNLCAESKIVLILTMFAGRVGILTFALALTSRHRVGNIRYPKEKIMIG